VDIPLFFTIWLLILDFYILSFFFIVFYFWQNYIWQIKNFQMEILKRNFKKFIGLFLILLVVIIWVGSSSLIQVKTIIHKVSVQRFKIQQTIFSYIFFYILIFTLLDRIPNFSILERTFKEFQDLFIFLFK
jgi:hypothetical protein